MSSSFLLKSEHVADVMKYICINNFILLHSWGYWKIHFQCNVCQRVRNVSFSKNVPYILNGWSISFLLECTSITFLAKNFYWVKKFGQNFRDRWTIIVIRSEGIEEFSKEKLIWYFCGSCGKYCTVQTTSTYKVYMLWFKRL